MADDVKTPVLNQSAGHTANLKRWEESEAAKVFAKESKDRDEAEKRAAEDQKEVPVEEVRTVFSEDTPEVTPVEDEGTDEGAPSKSASKAEWVDYAVEQGADREEAENTTKDDLVSIYG